MEEREKQRGNRILGSARGQFWKVHLNAAYDLEVDTHHVPYEEIIETIKIAASKSPVKTKKNEITSKISLIHATEKDKETIQNLGRFYVYEMSRYCGFLSGWDIPANGLFECVDLSSYCERPDRYAFLIQVNDELAGFILINKIGSSPDVDWNIGEFFIVSKYQGMGIGRYVAEQVFNQFPGIWETAQIPENTAAVDFWRKIVDGYTNGEYERSLKIIPDPTPHPMVVLKFASKKNDPNQENTGAR